MSATMTEEMQTLEKSCSNCGKTVRAEYPVMRSASLQALVERLTVLCDQCGTEQEKAWETEEQERRARAAAERHVVRIEASRVPERYQRIRFEDLEVDDENRGAMEAAKRWASGELRALVLAGPVGVGKTWIAAAASNERLRREPLRWFSAARLMAQARAGFDSPSRAEVTELLTRPDLPLVLDDLDKIKATDYALDIFFELIDERVANDTAILVTTNMRYEELQESFGEAIASRLSLCEGHRIEGSDRRQPE